MEEWNQDLETAASAVEQACRVAVRVQSRLATNETVIKEDRSPVTIADFAVQAVVSRHLATHLADLALVAEESASTLRTSDGAELLARGSEEVQCVTPDVQPTEILDAIDHGSHPGGASGRFWTLDPVDGTKGFLRGGQYAIALALIEDGQVVLGVLGCPNLAPGSTEAQPGEGALLTAVRGSGAHTIPLVGGPAEPIAVDEVNTPAEAVFCESVERAHSSHAAHARIAQELGVTSPPCRIDSQCKYAVLARGQASIYLRLPTRPGYEEKIWDHAAGSIVIEEAGGRVTDIAGAPLDFSLGHTLANNRGVIATNRRLHDRVLVAVATTLEP